MALPAEGSYILLMLDVKATLSAYSTSELDDQMTAKLPTPRRYVGYIHEVCGWKLVLSSY
jgi:hypothetical protein